MLIAELFVVVDVVACTLSRICWISGPIRLCVTWSCTLWWFDETTLVPADKSKGKLAKGLRLMGGAASAVYVGKVVPTEVSTATDESTNEDLSKDSGSRVEVAVVVLPDCLYVRPSVSFSGRLLHFDYTSSD